MENFLHLRKAPIIEATVELRTTISEEDTKKIKDSFIGKFGLLFNDLKTQSISFNPLKGDLAIPAPTLLGWEARNDTDVVQIKKDGFLFSRIKDYDSFSDLDKYIQKLVSDNYLKNFTRVGCRYINKYSIKKLHIPQELLSLSIYNDQKSQMQQISKREISKIDDFDIILITNVFGINEDSVDITLDIDVSQTKDIEINNINQIINDLRSIKNRIFFNYVDSYKEIFDPC